MPTTIQSLQIKSIEQVRDDYLRSYRNALINRGVPDPDVSQGTEIYNRATALAQQIYTASLSVPLAADAQMPDTAQGDDLGRVSSPYGLSLRPAGPSSGPGVLSTSQTTAVVQGSQLVDPNGLLYQVSVGGTYSTGNNIPIKSIGTGSATNLAAGTVLRWVSPPAYAAQTALVGAGGLTGGIDAEDQEGLRARLLDRLRNPPNGVNSASVNAAAEVSSTAVQKSFCYPAANGPSTLHFAVTRAPTATNKGRDVDALVLASTVLPAVVAQMPEFVEVNGNGANATVQNYPINVVFALSLPAAPSASPAGPGGGWIDGTPYPTLASSGFVTANNVPPATPTSFSLTTDHPPTIGQTICWLSQVDYVVRTAKITNIASLTGSGPFTATVTVDTALVDSGGGSIQSGHYVFPGAVNMANYVAAVLAGFAAMGPAEKVSATGLLPRALRRPTAPATWPSTFNRSFLKNLTNAGAEVSDAQVNALANTISPSPVTLTVSPPVLQPPYPIAITDGPFILTPNRLAFYPL